MKCSDRFHPSCLGQAANSKTSTCKHTTKKEENKQHLYNDIEIQYKIISVGNLYLKELLREVQEKNSILIQNNNLLLEDLEMLKNEKKIVNKQRE